MGPHSSMALVTFQPLICSNFSNTFMQSVLTSYKTYFMQSIWKTSQPQDNLASSNDTNFSLASFYLTNMYLGILKSWRAWVQQWSKLGTSGPRKFKCCKFDFKCNSSSLTVLYELFIIIKYTAFLKWQEVLWIMMFLRNSIQESSATLCQNSSQYDSIIQFWVAVIPIPK